MFRACFEVSACFRGSRSVFPCHQEQNYGAGLLGEAHKISAMAAIFGVACCIFRELVAPELWEENWVLGKDSKVPERVSTVS